MSPSDIALGVDKRVIDNKASKNVNKTMEDVRVMMRVVNI